MTSIRTSKPQIINPAPTMRITVEDLHDGDEWVIEATQNRVDVITETDSYSLSLDFAKALHKALGTIVDWDGS